MITAMNHQNHELPWPINSPPYQSTETNWRDMQKYLEGVVFKILTDPQDAVAHQQLSILKEKARKAGLSNVVEYLDQLPFKSETEDFFTLQ